MSRVEIKFFQFFQFSFRNETSKHHFLHVKSDKRLTLLSDANVPVHFRA